MDLRANSPCRAGQWSAVEARLVPLLVAAAKKAAAPVFAESQTLVHVRSGELRASGAVTTEWTGRRVSAFIAYSAPYAAYNEFGTGVRGQSSEWAGPYDYRQDWPGMRPIPFLRPALDHGRDSILDAYKSVFQV